MLSARNHAGTTGGRVKPGHAPACLQPARTFLAWPGMARRFVQLTAVWARCRRAEAGTAALEFALVCPLLVTGLLSAADLGLALNQRMTMDAMLRVGEEAALADPGVTRVRDVAINAAGDGVSAGSTSASPIVVSASRYCACPGSLTTSVSCSGSCATTTTPYLFYQLDADGYYTSIFLPRIALHSSVTVQIK